MLGVLGDLVEDVVVWLHEPMRHGTDSSVTIHKTRGGSAANVAAFAAAAHPTRFFGCVGDDSTGDAVVRELEGHGVDVAVQRRGETGTIVLLVDETGERTMLPDRGASLRLEAIPADQLAGIDLLHIPAYAFEGEALRTEVLRTIERANAAGIALSIDASSAGMLAKLGSHAFLAIIADVAPRFLIANADEAAILGLVGDGAAAKLAGIASTVVVLKDGARSTRIVNAGEQIIVAVPPVKGVRDSIGAGDAFAAGFLTGYLDTGDLLLACERGHARAAAVLHSPGASVGPAPSPHD